MAPPSKPKAASAVKTTSSGSKSKTTAASRGRVAGNIGSKSTADIPSIDGPFRPPSSAPRQRFRFFDLPSELRVRIYEEILLVKDGALDLDQNNVRLIKPRLALFLVSRRTHHEAHSIFYSQPVRLFPHHNHGRFFHTKKPLLTRLPPHYRAVIRSIELRFGSGWSKPPACQNTGPALGLRDCVRLRTLKIFVDCDPSDGFFNGFRGKDSTEETYTVFCLSLLSGIFEQVPSLEGVEIDAFVKKDAPLVAALQRQVEQAGLALTWGPNLKAWEKQGVEPELIGLEQAMSGLGLDAPSEGLRLVEVQA